MNTLFLLIEPTDFDALADVYEVYYERLGANRHFKALVVRQGMSEGEAQAFCSMLAATPGMGVRGTEESQNVFIVDPSLFPSGAVPL